MLDRPDRIIRIALSAFVMLLAVSHVAAQGPAAASPAGCESLMRFQLPGVSLTVTKAQQFPAGTTPSGPDSDKATVKLPAYCRVDGMIDRRTGAGGVTFGIGFAMALPEGWNGRFLFQGGSGLNGSVLPPMGTSAAGTEPGLARGFAVVSTDSGHQGPGPSFLQDQQATLDYSYAAIGRVAEAAKHIIAQYYGKAPSRSYFAGCSEGGREAMLVAQRYATDFDGIVAGAPAMRPNISNIGNGNGWIAATLNEIAPKDQNGLPITANALSEGDKKTVIDGLLRACDTADGLQDGMVFNIQGCRFDPKALVCRGEKADGCLSLKQAETLQKAFGGPKDSKGRQVYPRFPFDTGLVSMERRPTPGLLNGGGDPFAPKFSEIGMDVDSAVEKAMSLPAAAALATLGGTWDLTNLNTFSGHGGKLIFWHGVSDPSFSPLDTVDYYERMTKANGGSDQVRKWSRLFLSPGMGHCRGGPAALDTFDALSAIVRWVEQDAPPDSLTATGPAFPGRSRPLCAYPLHAQYKGAGNPEDAANFECRP
jgi:feruloyl esterase